MEKTTYNNGDYVVGNDNIFGFVTRSTETLVSICVVRADYLAGGDPLLINRVTCVSKERVRPATKDDGERFSVKVF